MKNITALTLTWGANEGTDRYRWGNKQGEGVQMSPMSAVHVIMHVMMVTGVRNEGQPGESRRDTTIDFLTFCVNCDRFMFYM